MKRHIICLFTLTFFIINSANAVLKIEITQGVNKPLPIAVVPFGGQSVNVSEEDNIAGIISSDLQNSGRFHLMPVREMKQKPTDIGEVDFKYWQAKQPNDLVIGKVTALNNQRFRVSFQLVEVYSSASNTSHQEAVLLQRTFVVPSSEMRQLAHHMSDLIYKKLTGKRGVFSTKIAYVAVNHPLSKDKSYLLEIADIDGHNPQLLLRSEDPIMSPAWSPDGKEIAYVSYEDDGRPSIFVQQIITGKRQQITHYSGINGAPAWSPDGKQLAFVLTKTDYPKIYTYDLTTQKLTRVTDGFSMDTEPSWSPNAQSILFTSSRGGGPQIYEINLVSKKIHRLTYRGHYNARASFTPDGKSIIMLHRDDSSYNIGIQNLKTGVFKLLTESSDDQSPSVAPNSDMIVYATQYGGRGILAIVSTDDRVKLRLPLGTGDVREPAWSPFLM